ncbi:hypothetical protein MRX96_027571 [Rhipicephalus microplus]
MAVCERDSAFQKLQVTGDRRAWDEFTRNALRLARSEGFSGLRLWWGEFQSKSIVVQSFLRTVRHVVAALRKAKCSLGFLFPYPAVHSQSTSYASGLRVLDKVLASAASILLYPTTSVLGDVIQWPSPSQMMGVGGETSVFNNASPSRSFCHLLPSVTAVSVELANASGACDANATQRVKPTRTLLSHARLSKLCRSWDASSGKVSLHRHHNYVLACGFGKRGKTPIVYQTPQQALRYRRELLAITQSMCFGFLGGHMQLPAPLPQVRTIIFWALELST